MRSWNRPRTRRSDAVNRLVGIGVPVAISARVPIYPARMSDGGSYSLPWCFHPVNEVKG
jgi:hypothetical protein